LSAVCGTCLPGGCAVATHALGDWIESAEGDHSSPGGRSPHLLRGAKRILEGERASEGRGCLERGTLNADRKANRKGAVLFNDLSHGPSSKSQLRVQRAVTDAQEGRAFLYLGLHFVKPGSRPNLLQSAALGSASYRAANVCAAKVRVPLVARQGHSSPQEGLVTLLCAERRRAFGVALRAGKARRGRGPGRRWPPSRLQAGRMNHALFVNLVQPAFQTFDAGHTDYMYTSKHPLKHSRIHPFTPRALPKRNLLIYR
jgi:hypothetical protein